ncbi:hypothetical protein SCP_0110360 [Sparassis crispa]|uniref:ATP-dependent DNA helicase n=1 Tax=Sparassis crispa TaxID=139825 RepID=A0A401G7M7_9APHY|nr:hypothetical protein SCP_0110360 [Sparassis crispa]GBE78153.1 hypothetical protein SCP_0110360 [Sparassis crispa]
MKVKPDLLAARRWIYPLNHPKRDYQFNIVRHCLFENTLVALPTGLGKTFIAGTVMLNFYNWFPEGKVVFLAPTKPLVAQQIEACHQTCGIPGSHAAELTGGVPKAKRARLWDEKRVFYMTPQTLQSDFMSNNFDPAEIVLVVFDEAHRGTGDYSYAQLVRFLMAKNPHVRILALTATPGSDPEAVQSIVDCLHISHIEIRDEKSLDLFPYLNDKRMEQHTISMDEDIKKVRDLLGKIMLPLIKAVQGAGAMRGNADPIMLHSYRCQQSMKELRGAPPFAFAAARKLVTLARAMGYLLEASMGMCYGAVQDLVSSSNDKANNAVRGLAKDQNFQALVKELEAQKSRGFSLHPKMDKLRTLLVQHFAGTMIDREDTKKSIGEAGDPRVIVFVSFRECVDEVVELLSKENPLIRATPFIGQGTDKQGRKGLAQKEQLEVIKKFKAGEFNVLVSTSIGEEGLDIGEVDMIVCYDAQKSPIRMLQRIGRTGRKRDGLVHVLLAEGREEKNWMQAEEKYKDVQNFIVNAEQLELYGDVERLLPDHMHPECVEMHMEIEEHVREDPHSRKGSLAQGDSPPAKGTKRKRDDNPMRNIPPGALTGFAIVKDLLVKRGASKKKRKVQEFDITAGHDDSDDLEIEAGLHGPRRTASASAVERPLKTKKLKRAKTVASGEGAKKSAKTSKKKSKPVEDPTGTQFDRLVMEDSDDIEIEKGLQLSEKPRSARTRTTDYTHSLPEDVVQSTPFPMSRASSSLVTNHIIDLTTPEPYSRRDDSSRSPAPRSPSPRSRSRSSNSIFEDRPPFADRSSDPPGGSPPVASRSVSLDQNCGGADMSWLLEDDEDLDVHIVHSSPPGPRRSPSSVATDDEVEFVEGASASPVQSPEVSGRISSKYGGGFTNAQRVMNNMPPPALPSRSFHLTPPSSDDAPEPSFAVRPAGKQAKKRAVSDLRDSSPLQMPPPSQRRLQRQRNSSSPLPNPEPPKRPKKRKFKDIAEAQKLNPWIDVEATHSGDENSQGSSDVDQLGNESDRQFLQEPPETQVSRSYDQAAVYRRSLFTQAPGTAPVFAHRPLRRGLGAFVPAGRARTAASSPPRNADGDEYIFGSFVVDDDAEIAYMDSSEA